MSFLFLLLIIFILIFFFYWVQFAATSEPKLCVIFKFKNLENCLIPNPNPCILLLLTLNGVGHLLNNYMMSFDSIINFMKLTIMSFSLLEIAMLANRISYFIGEIRVI